MPTRQDKRLPSIGLDVDDHLVDELAYAGSRAEWRVLQACMYNQPMGTRDTNALEHNAPPPDKQTHTNGRKRGSALEGASGSVLINVYNAPFSGFATDTWGSF